MIPNITSGSNYFGLLSYLEKKDNREINIEGGLQIILGSERIVAQNFLKGNEISLLSEKQILSLDFKAWDKMSKSKNFEKKVAHFSLSFAPQDTLDKGKTIQIANEFLEKMGYKENPAAIYQHNDKHHNHIHIVTSRVGADGKKINHDKELVRAIKICRELEIKYQLTEVIKGQSVQNNLDKTNNKTINANADVPFRNAIIQNLQYYLNVEKVTDMKMLQEKFLLHKIEMVLHDKNGQQLPKNGVRFYHKEGNKIISYLSGKNIEKKFIPNLEKKLKANTTKTFERIIVTEEKKNYIPTQKPSYTIQKAIGTILYDALQSCANSVSVTQGDLKTLLEVHKIEPEFKTDKEGNLTGLSYIYGGVRYKGSDFTVKGIKLSAQLLAPHITEKMSGAKIIQFAINAVQTNIKETNSKISKQELIEILNRNGIKLMEAWDGKNSLIINKLGKNFSINLENYPNGYSGFLSAVGISESAKLSKEIQDKIKGPVSLVAPLNFQQKAVYAALLKGEIKGIQEISKVQIDFKLTNTEINKLSKPIGILKHYNLLHNLMSRSNDYLKYLTKKTGVIPNVIETIKALNLRGVAIIPTYENIEKEGAVIKKLKRVEFLPIGDSSNNPPLNFFQTIKAFGSENLKEIFENLSPKDEIFINQKTDEPGVYFVFEQEARELIIAAESEPSLIHDNKEELLEEYPELEKEIAYIESLEKEEHNKGLYTYPDRNTLSTIFKDHGRMVNRGADGTGFKTLKSKYKSKRKK